MSVLQFLNNLKKEDIKILSIENYNNNENDLETEQKEEIARVTYRANIDGEDAQFNIYYDLLNHKNIWFESSDLNLLKRKINPFQMRIFFIETLTMVDDVSSDVLTQNLDIQVIKNTLRKIKLFLIYYNS